MTDDATTTALLAGIKPDPFAALVEELKLAAGHWCYHGRSGQLEEFAKRLLAAPAEPPKEDAEIAMLRRIYITDPMPGWFAAPENAAANIRMLLERLSAPPSGEVAALIERLRAMADSPAAPFGWKQALHKIADTLANVPEQDDIARTLERRITHAERQLVNAKTEIARLSAPVPRQETKYCHSCGAVLLGKGGEWGIYCGDCNAAIGAM